MSSPLKDKSVLLIISGGIAAYKALDLIRRLREEGAGVTVILTKAAQEFVTPLSVSALSGNRVYGALFSLTDESEMGHIRLARQADIVVVAPASADIMARHAHGLADDLATTALLASAAPVMMVPSMNLQMWRHPATQDNMALLQQRGVKIQQPDEGPMACGEFGRGRFPETLAIVEEINGFLHSQPKGVQRGSLGHEAEQTATASKGVRPADPLTGPFPYGPSPDVPSLDGLRVLVTAGPTHEPIDPVRYIANRSSGKQGYAIASALAGRGAEVTLISGPTNLPAPSGVSCQSVETAIEMLEACQRTAVQDVIICAAAVADWRVKNSAPQKQKKKENKGLLRLELVENPDILATLSQQKLKPSRLIIGFAAETESVLENAIAKRQSKGCDWIIANSVAEGSGTFGGDENAVTIITANSQETWPASSKALVAERLADAIAAFFTQGEKQ